MRASPRETLLSLMAEYLISVDASVRESLADHYELILEENEIQNLTRTTEPEDYLWKQIYDAVEIARSGIIDPGARCLDVGSGSGQPGIVAALLGVGGAWVLAESEGSKARFLASAVERLGLGARVSVYAGRAEELLQSESFDVAVFKALGSVSKILTLVGQCSTWNILLLLKGPIDGDRSKVEWRDARGALKSLHLERGSPTTYQTPLGTRTLETITRRGG